MLVLNWHFGNPGKDDIPTTEFIIDSTAGLTVLISSTKSLIRPPPLD
jgi:hypothetical protein